MAIEFARSHVLSRSSGHSAVKAAAYRAGEKLMDERTGQVADYSSRSGDVGHSEILLPEGASSELLDRTALWSAVEDREDQHNRRASAQLAVDNIIALPVGLSKDQHIQIAKSFAESEFVSKGLAVDLAIHYHSDGNPHAHLMTTTRQLEGKQFGKKLREVNGKFFGGFKMADAEQLRHRWAAFQNDYFKDNGIDDLATNNNGEYQAEKHLGAAHDMHKKGQETELFEKVQEIRTARVQAIFDRPEIIIERVADKKAVFKKHDLFRELHKVIKSADDFAQIKAKIEGHESLVRMSEVDGQEFLTTIDTLKIEQSIRLTSDKLMNEDERFSVKQSDRKSVLQDYDFLSKEQITAINHLTGKERFGLVMGLAGAGKSTMLEAVRRINEHSGNQTYGVALAGKAAAELEKSSGISSRTIASFIYGISSGRIELKAGDVLAIDELGMVSNKQANELLQIAESSGAKVIGVGDTEQLQSIQAGAVLRDLSQRHGYAGIETIRRQAEQWQRDATYDLAKGRTAAAVSAYREHGNLHSFDEHSGGAHEKLISDYLADDKNGSKAVLAHRKTDVKELNENIRNGLIEQGLLGKSNSFLSNSGRDEQRLAFDLEVGDEVIFKSKDIGLGIREEDTGTFVGIENGDLSFVHDDGRNLKFSADSYCDIDIPDKPDTKMKIDLSVGDRILFTRNDRELGVSNGQLGTLLAYRGGELSVRTDTGDVVKFRQDEYSDISHGYATTVHKSQGMTVDRAYLLGSGSMDKHLAYVGMSRHKDALEIYTNDEARFLYAVSRDNRQETALNFAQTRGLELVSDAHSETISQILAGQVVDDMAVRNRVETISKEDYQRATRLLETETTRIAAQLSESAKQPLRELELKSDDLAGEIKKLEGEKPKPGLFKSKSYRENERNWEHRLNVKTAERNGVLRQIENATSGKVFIESQEKIQKEAGRQAARTLPKEASIAKGYKADIQLSELNNKLNSINKEITKARTANDEKKLPQLLKRKSNILNSLQNRSSLKLRQGKEQRTQVAKAILSTKSELGVFKARGMGLGR